MFIAWIIHVRCFHKFPLVYFGWLFLSVFKWETRTSSSYNKNQDERKARGQESTYDATVTYDRPLYPSLPKTVISSIFSSSKRPRYRCHLLSFSMLLYLWKCNLRYANWNTVNFYIWKNKLTLLVNSNNKNAFLLSVDIRHDLGQGLDSTGRLILANLYPYCI